MSQKLKNELNLKEFFELLYRYVSVAGNYTRVKNEIRLRRAMILKAFLREYLESSYEDVRQFAGEFFENAPVFIELIR